MLLHNFINKNEKEILEELRTKLYFFHYYLLIFHIPELVHIIESFLF